MHLKADSYSIELLQHFPNKYFFLKVLINILI